MKANRVVTFPRRAMKESSQLNALAEAWLAESGLTHKTLPGEIQKSAYRMYYFDIDGQRNPAADIHRFLLPDADPKYLYPKDEPPHIYYPPLVKNKKFDWRNWARGSAFPRFVTEGWKKAARASALGFPCVGLNGCWGFSAKKHGYLWLPEFNDWLLEDADLYWIPDRDRNPKSVADVVLASTVFGWLMTEAEVKFHVVQLPLLESDKKVGLDDYLCRSTPDEFLELIESTGPWEDWPVSDPGNADRWVAMYGERFKYLGARGWHFFDSRRWTKDTLLAHQATANTMFKEMIEGARTAGNTERATMLQKHATAHRIKDVGELARSAPTIADSIASFDRHPLLLNCLNGTLNMERMVLRLSDPADRITRIVNANYSPQARCPEFLRAMEWWTNGDKDLQRTLRQLLGLSLTGITREQIFMVLHGPPQTGKSRLIEIFKYILNDYGCSLPSEALLVRRNGVDEERKLAKIVGARFATVSETSGGDTLDESLIKHLTGEDGMSARMLYSESFDFVPEAKLWLRTNNPPRIHGADGAIWRRLVAIPFGKEVPESKRDKDLPGKLEREADGILAWAVEGYRDYAESGLVRAKTIEDSNLEYRKGESAIDKFFEDACVLGSEFYEGREKLFKAFEVWLAGRKWKRWNTREFKRELSGPVFRGRVKEKQKRIDGKVYRVWGGVRLKTPRDMAMGISKEDKF